MPFQQGTRLPGERASKLGHLDILNSDLVNKLIQQFEYPDPHPHGPVSSSWLPIDLSAKPLSLIFAVDGSLQVVKSDSRPVRELAFVKTALLRLDPRAVARLDKEYPHPLALRQMMQNSALFHSTVFPLRNVSIPGHSYLNGMRQIVYDSLCDPRLESKPFETLKWIAYQKWDPSAKEPSPNFQCPHCGESAPGLPYDANEGACPACGEHIYISDIIGLHMELVEDAAAMGFATSYMLIHELLMLFTGIRYFWENNRAQLKEALFIKDGPFLLRSQYSKFVERIRKFFKYAYDKGINIHVIGQEKSGLLFDHLQEIERFVPPHIATDEGRYSILSHGYIRNDVQRTPGLESSYGLKTNYGEKVLVKPTHLHSLVLNAPVVEYHEDSNFPHDFRQFIGLDRIFATLPNLLSHRFQGALLPVELANGVASLSSYPSARILKVFAGI